MKRLYPLLSCLLAALPALAQAPAPTPGMLAQHPLLWCLLAAVVGAVLGGGLMTRVLKQEHRAQLHQARQQGREEGKQSAGVKAVQPATDYELRLRKEKQELQKQLDDTLAALKRQGKGQGKQERKAAQPPVAAPPVPTTSSVGTITGADMPVVTIAASELPPETLPEPLPTPVPEAPSPLRYAPAQETGFLRDNKLATEPLPQLPLQLTLNPGDPEKADFTLNPHVNQAKLIGDGLHQLREFFDFDLPTGRIAGVSADAPGQLARQGDGWQVVSRARLLVR